MSILMCVCVCVLLSVLLFAVFFICLQKRTNQLFISVLFVNYFGERFLYKKERK